MTPVVHVNSAEWTLATLAGTAVYCARAVLRAKEPLAHVESVWANPHRIKHGPLLSYAAARVDAIRAYRCTLRGRLLNGVACWSAKNLRADLLSLDGLTLGCWCKDPKLPWDHPKQREPQNACHCDVIVELLEELKQGK